MRNAWIVILVLAFSPALALAGETPTPLEVVEKLAAHIEKGDADFDNTLQLYKDAKEALKSDTDGAAKARYDEIRPSVANAMRRDEMPGSAWLMGIFGATLLWGGFAFCIGVARKKGGGKGSA